MLCNQRTNLKAKALKSFASLPCLRDKHYCGNWWVKCSPANAQQKSIIASQQMKKKTGKRWGFLALRAATVRSGSFQEPWLGCPHLNSCVSLCIWESTVLSSRQSWTAQKLSTGLPSRHSKNVFRALGKQRYQECFFQITWYLIFNKKEREFC